MTITPDIVIWGHTSTAFPDFLPNTYSTVVSRNCSGLLASGNSRGSNRALNFGSFLRARFFLLDRRGGDFHT
jgi:hypothetical protein